MSENPKHTNGPWMVRKARTMLHIGNELQCAVSISISPPRIPERDLREQAVARAWADAHLVSATPDFYDTALEIIAAWDHDEIGQIDGKLIDKLRAAISKAEGRS